MPRAEQKGRADFAHQVAKVKKSATDAGCLLDKPLKKYGADAPRLKAWLMRLIGPKASGGNQSQKKEGEKT